MGRNLRGVLAPVAMAAAVFSHCGGTAPKPVVADSLPPFEPPAVRDDGHLPHTFVPEEAALELALLPGFEAYSGEVLFRGKLPGATRAIVLHARDLALDDGSIELGGARRFRVDKFIGRPSHGAVGADEVVLVFNEKLPEGPATLRLRFHAKFSQQLRGFYAIRDGGAPYAFTQFEPADARRAFPCFDEPAFKVPFTLAMKVPKGNIAVANMPEKKREEFGGFTRFEFEKSPPVPSYLVAFAAGPLEVREGAAVRLITTKGKTKLGARALDVAPRLLAKLEEYTGVKYPYPKLDLLAIPDFAAGAMENPGLITFREELLLLDSTHASGRAKRDQISVIAHELAHQWFGDYVTPTWWDDLWLNEGFATWAQVGAIDMAYPGMLAADRGVISSLAAMRADELATARSVHDSVTSVAEAESSFDDITYQKGASVLRTLEVYLEPEKLRAAVRAYLKKKAHGVATYRDFLEELEGLAPGSAAAVAPLLTTRGVPVLRLTPPSCEVARRLLRIEPYVWAPFGETTLARTGPLPICMSLNGKKTCVDFANGVSGDKDASSIVLGIGSCKDGAYAFPNMDGKMYYRFDFAKPAGWAELGKARRRLRPGERLALLSSAWASFRSGAASRLSAAELLPFLKTFDDERDPLVLGELVRTYEEMSELLDQVDRTSPFGVFVSARLDRVRDAVGWNAQPKDLEEHVHLRRSLYSFLARTLHDKKTLAEAEALAQKWLTKRSTVEPDAGGLALQLASLRASESRLSELKAVRDSEPMPEDRVTSIRAVGLLGDAPLFAKGLTALVNEANFRLQDVRPLFGAARSHRDGRVALFDWVRSAEGAKLLARLEGGPVRDFLSPIEALCNDADIAEAKKWLEALNADPKLAFKERAAGSERSLREGFMQAERCVRLRKTLGAELGRALMP